MFKNFRKNLSVLLMNKSDNFIIAARAIELSSPNDDLNEIFNHLVHKALVYEIYSKLLYHNN